jgi:uncharacterized protein (DUF488 family)
MATLRVNKREVMELFDNLEELAPDVMKDAGVFFRNKTPVRSGNARNKTKQKDNVINAQYPYAGRLDEGWSKQQPKGMSAPTEKQIDILVGKYIKRVT